jgi:predicted transposase/invertase (TIGR01784 family)
LLPGEPSYINTYEFRNDKTGGSFTDLIKFVILELPKLPHKEDSEVWPWLKLFTCKERNQYEELAKQYPEVGMAVQVLKRLSLIGRIRMLVDDLEIQRRDNEAAREYELYEAREKGLQEGLTKLHQTKLDIARKMKGLGMAPDQIAIATGLSNEEIADLS